MRTYTNGGFKFGPLTDSTASSSTTASLPASPEQLPAAVPTVPPFTFTPVSLSALSNTATAPAASNEATLASLTAAAAAISNAATSAANAATTASAAASAAAAAALAAAQALQSAIASDQGPADVSSSSQGNGNLFALNSSKQPPFGFTPHAAQATDVFGNGGVQQPAGGFFPGAPQQQTMRPFGAVTQDPQPAPGSIYGPTPQQQRANPFGEPLSQLTASRFGPTPALSTTTVPKPFSFDSRGPAIADGGDWNLKPFTFGNLPTQTSAFTSAFDKTSSVPTFVPFTRPTPSPFTSGTKDVPSETIPQWGDVHINTEANLYGYEPPILKALNAAQMSVKGSTSGSIPADLLGEFGIHYVAKQGSDTGTLKGPVRVPLDDAAAESLYADSLPSGFTQRVNGVSQKVVDEKHRFAREVTPPSLLLSVDPAAYLLHAIANHLQLPVDSVSTSIVKLNLYTAGGRFGLHTDRPRGEGHLGTLVINLPSFFTGGELSFHDQAQQKDILHAWGMVNTLKPELQWTFFPLGTEHQVQEVRWGYRVTLQYAVYSTATPQNLSSVFKRALASDNFMNAGGVLLFALEGSYTAADLDRMNSTGTNASTPSDVSDALLVRAVAENNLEYKFVILSDLTQEVLAQYKEEANWIVRPEDVAAKRAKSAQPKPGLFGQPSAEADEQMTILAINVPTCTVRNPTPVSTWTAPVSSIESVRASGSSVGKYGGAMLFD